LAEKLSFGFVKAERKPPEPFFTAQSHILLYGHAASGAQEGILEDSSYQFGAFIFMQFGYILIIDKNLPFRRQNNSGYHVQKGGFAGTIGTDDGDKISFFNSKR
jgi:hypothetical protein